MKILVACEFSQVVTKAFRDNGHEAYSCDLLPTEGNPDWHIQANVLRHLDDGWDLMIAHPPCTYLANSGVRWLFEQTDRGLDRIDKMEQAFKFFMRLWKAEIGKICVENPIPHPYGLNLVNPGKYTQLIQPHYFIGSNESKATCLWLRNLPKLERTQWLGKSEIKQSVFRMPPSKTRGKERSRFPVSIAKAMAEQWG